MFFSGIGWAHYGFWRGRPQKWSAIFIASHQGYVPSTGLISLVVDLGGGSTCQISLLPPPPILFSLEGSHYIEPTLEMHLTQAGLFGFPLPSIWNWDLEVLVSVQVLVAWTGGNERVGVHLLPCSWGRKAWSGEGEQRVEQWEWDNGAKPERQRRGRFCLVCGAPTMQFHPLGGPDARPALGLRQISPSAYSHLHLLFFENIIGMVSGNS